MRNSWPAVLLAGWVAVAPGSGVAAEGDAAPVSRFIVGLRPEGGTARGAAPGGRVEALAWRSGLKLRRHQAIGPVLQVVELEQPVTGPDVADVTARLQADAAVAFAEPDARVRRHAIANDPLFFSQWYLQGDEPAAIDAQGAWDVTTGSAGIVVAVLDTGVRFDHPDLLQAGRGGRLLPGYDFVRADADGGFRVANDGDGWDPNPADPGDWVSDSDTRLPVFTGCEVGDSSWHGTRVAGMIGALANNSAGITGGTWGAWVLPVRVLGKCGGSNSDILQGMRWAAGLHVEGVPDNPYPARVLNLSLGGSGSCSLSYQTVIAELQAIGVLVVASAGNSGGAVEYPASCPGVAAVAGLRHVGTKVGYSSLGPQVTVSAPAGNCVNLTGPCLFSLDTTVDRGTTAPAGPAYTSPVAPNVGTSFAAPQVSVIAALMLSVDGNLGPPQLIGRIRASARPFPAPPVGVPLCHVPAGGSDLQQSECGCTTATCGAGMAYAPAALAEAARPIAAVALPAAVSAGQDVRLDATGSGAACNRVIAGYSWAPLAGAPAISGADTATATLQAPASGTVTVRLTVTDDQGATDSADVVVGPGSASSSAPASAGARACPSGIVPADPGPFVDDGPARPAAGGGGGGGGGGSLGWAGLLGLVLAALGRRRAA